MESAGVKMEVPSLSEIEEQERRLASRLYVTPVREWDTPLKRRLLGEDAQAVFKLELFQKTGSFKARGALTVMDRLSPRQKENGVVAGTGGNHGIAVAFAAQNAQVGAKIVVPRTINPFRLKAIEAYGACVIQVDDISLVLAEMRRIAEAENRAIMHPFENPLVTLGTATLGFEFLRQEPGIDVVIVPIGGGGLASGVSCAAKQINPRCKVYGVEPSGANAMTLSLREGHPVALPGGPKSIADSLSAPCTEPYSFSVCQKYLDDVVLIEEDEMRAAMRILFEDLKLAVEPAGAAATAALLGPLKDRCKGLKVGLIVCGSNIDTETFYSLLS
jgi:threonine dehydratase